MPRKSQKMKEPTEARVVPKAMPEEPESLPEVSKKTMWTGTISLGDLGFVTVPVKLVTMEQEHKVPFHLYRRSDKSSIKMPKVSEKDGKEVKKEEMVRGIKEGKEIIFVEDAELNAVKPESSRVIKLDRFVDVFEVDPIYYEKSYIITPDGKNRIPYDLMREALLRANKAGIGTATIRDVEHPAIVHAYEDGLVLTLLHYADEIIKPSQIKSVKEHYVPAPEEKDKWNMQVDMAKQIIDNLSGSFNIHEYKDTTYERVRNLIEMKKAGQPVPTKVEPKAEAPPDMFAALKATLEATKKKKGGK